EYKQSESVYSNFKYFVVVDDNSELKMELTENEKLYRCELNIYGSKRRTKQRSPTHDQVDSIKNEKSISVYDDDDDCNDVDDDDDDNDEDDDEDDDDEEDADREYIDYVELVFGERKG
ncbi:trigger factor, partial [Biomphalaria glabrata]